jgi:hypothetical protein
MSHIEIDPVKVTIKRAWNDVSRKLIAFLATGLTSTGLIAGLAYAGIHIDAPLATLLVVVISALAGYIKPERAVIDGGLVVDGQPAVITTLEHAAAPAQTINVYPPAGVDEAEIARIAASNIARDF